ncbi:MAG: UDP-N-acetylmuramate dehydrogenase, partial [Phycisphaerae bacterium]|nr:UDP-N-acetylmuramate dehydrogenase [Phycisphaerae bacterium]
DDGVKGAVVQLAPQNFRKITIEEDLVRAGAAAMLNKVISAAARAHLGGLGCLVGIPGTVGGAVKMNAGGAFGDIGQSVERVKVMDTYGHTFYRERDGLAFGYRASNISARFILDVELRLAPDTERAIIQRMKQIWIARKNTQPVTYGSAGCIFKNPRGMSAGALIDQSGLKGTKVGKAMVSRKHANYIVVQGRGKAGHVRELIETIREKVYERFGTYLELEIEVWS